MVEKKHRDYLISTTHLSTWDEQEGQTCHMEGVLIVLLLTSKTLGPTGCLAEKVNLGNKMSGTNL